MSSNGEEDDTEDLEALRKAALATLKPKAQPIEQVISIGTSRNQTPEWSEVPASVDYPGFADHVPEPNPFPVPHHGLIPQPHLRQPSPTAWRGHHFMNGIPATRFKFQGFPGDRQPFLFHPRHSHRTFGDRGRPLHDRGRRPRRGYVTNRGGFSLTNVNSSIPTGHTPGHIPGPDVPIASVTEPVPSGGNLIVIQPHNSTDISDNFTQDSKRPVSQPVVSTSKECTSSTTVAPENTSAPSPQKPKLMLPQDRYHSSQTSSVEEIKKSDPEQPMKKPKDKFSRYDKSDSEDEDDWMESHSEVDDIAKEIDKFLQDVDQDEATQDKDVNEEDSKVEEPVPEELQASEEISDLIAEEEELGSQGSSPATSEAESLDLDALANGDPVIGDFDDLDFLVDKEPISDSVSDTVRLTASDRDHSAICVGAQLSERTVDKGRETTPVSSSSSPPSSVSRSPMVNPDKERKSSENDGSISKDSDANAPPKHHSKSSVAELSRTRSLSPISNKSSPRDKVQNLEESRSPCPQSHSSHRSRSPIPKRLSPRRSPLSPRRSPLANHESLFRRRSPRRRSLSPHKRMPRCSSSPKRLSSPIRQNASPQRKALYPHRSNSPHGRRRSPYQRSASPHVRDRYRNDSRNRKDYEAFRKGGENLRYGGRLSQGSLSPSSRPQERGRGPDAMGKNRWSPNRNDRKAQQTQSRDTSLTGSIGNNYNGREDPSKGVFMDDKELEKLSPEERAKIEARRKKFASKQEVKLEDAKKTVSLKSIKERKKKMKKNEKKKDDPLDAGLSEVLPKKTDKSGISLKALRKKMKLKKTNQEDSSDEDQAPSPSLNDLEDDSEDSDAGRAWKQEGNKAKSLRSIRPHSNTINHRLDHRERSRPKSQKTKEYRKAHHSPVTKTKTSRFQSDSHKNEDMSDEDDYNENIPSSRLGSSIVASSRFKLDVPPKKLRIQIQVAPKDKKSKKSKSKPDFSNVYSVPAKRRLGNKDDTEDEEEENEEKAVPKKKAKKKEKKVKKKKSGKDDPEENIIAAVSADPVPKPRPSILERLGKKVGLDAVEKKKKKKKSKQSHMDNGEKDDLDQHIEKMKLKNAAIERRQREIQLDKERYG